MDYKEHPVVGTAVLIFKDSKVLLGKRKSSHGSGEYALPGGKLDYKETLKECIRRETLEETGLLIKNIQFNCIADELEYLPRHFLHVGFIADWESGEPKVMEPDKCESWDWYSIDKLPEPLFAMTRVGIEAHTTGKKFFGK